ncbi:hypothetical protein HYX13_00905 [Candidatus Woesearchaeota archaeon]|nr:hypothetical protein [Candidatus Woesearchaeota archaeon]
MTSKHQALLKLSAEERIKETKGLLLKLEKELIKEKEGVKEKNSEEKSLGKKKENQNEIEKEIALIKNIIREAEQELSERGKRKERIPIEEIAAEELEGLSQEGKNMVKALKNIHEKKTERAENQEKEQKQNTGRETDQKRKYEILEETIVKEGKNLPPGTAERPTAEMQYRISSRSPLGGAVAYGVQSTKPLGELYQEASALRKSIEEKGYVSQADERKAEYFTAAVQGRMQAVEEGTYSLSEQAARAASLTQMIGENIQQTYRGKRKNEWYN